MANRDLGDREAKAVDIASTYHQVLIGLASGIITAVLGIYPNLLTITTLNFLWLQMSLICFGCSVFAGLMALGGLVTSTAKKQKDPIPTNSLGARIPGTFQ